jgi:hypothetical protein
MFEEGLAVFKAWHNPTQDNDPSSEEESGVEILLE